MQLRDPSLLKTGLFIDGTWVQGDGMEVLNPADDSHLARVACGHAEHAEAVVVAAERAFGLWRHETAQARCALLRRWFDLMVEHAEDLAQIMTYEQGKPLAESRGEIAYAASFLEWFSEGGKRLYGDVIPHNRRHVRLLTLKQPVGVAAGITPWNFPAAMITRKAGAAIAAGCTFVLKPAEDTPLSALALAELSQRAGLPAGVFNVVVCSREQAGAVGEVWTDSPVVRKLSFTGSTAVGKHLMARSASTVKKLSLELGGNAPFIVFDDADLEQAVDGLMISKFRNAGQTCVCANRILVQDGIFGAFKALLEERIKALRVGNGWEDGVTIGPLINDRALEKVDRLVTQAVGAGAKVVLGGSPAPGVRFYQPSLLEEVDVEMAMSQEEIFGPVAGLIRFGREDDAVAMANDTPMGLAGYFYARDVGRCWRVAEALECGMVGVNTGLLSAENVPFGGIKESGLGREGSYQGLEEWVEEKYLCLGQL